MACGKNLVFLIRRWERANVFIHYLPDKKLRNTLASLAMDVSDLLKLLSIMAKNSDVFLIRIIIVAPELPYFYDHHWTHSTLFKSFALSQDWDTQTLKSLYCSFQYKCHSKFVSVNCHGAAFLTDSGQLTSLLCKRENQKQTKHRHEINDLK